MDRMELINDTEIMSDGVDRRYRNDGVDKRYIQK